MNKQPKPDLKKYTDLISEIFKQLKNRLECKHSEKKNDEGMKELILRGENESVEFKSTMRYDLREGKTNSKLEFVIAKTVSAFLNSEGGSLIIGVNDEGNILGLQNDFATLPKKDSDGFELHLRQIIKKYLGGNFGKYIKVSFPVSENKEICLVKVSKCSKSVFITSEGKDYFFVRNGNSSIPLNRQEQSEYEREH